MRSLVEEERVVLKRLREVFAQSNVVHIPSLKAKDRKLVNVEVRLVNGLIHNVKTENITEVNILMYAGAFVIAERLGMRLRFKRMAREGLRRKHIGRDGSMGISRGGGKI